MQRKKSLKKVIRTKKNPKQVWYRNCNWNFSKKCDKIQGWIISSKHSYRLNMIKKTAKILKKANKAKFFVCGCSFGCKKCTLGRLGSLFAPRAHQTIDRWRWQTRIWAAWAEFHMQKMRYFAYFDRFFSSKCNQIVVLLHMKWPVFIRFLSFL